MDRIKIVVWDNIGNTLLGVRPWSSWSPSIQRWLIEEDPDAEVHAPSFAQLFAGHDVELHWFLGEMSGPGIFGSLADDFSHAVHELTDIHQLTGAIADADYVVIHKQTLPAGAVLGARRLRLLQHLGQDYRGVPMPAARERGIPVAATPLVNYIAVAEHVWALILNHLKRLHVLRGHIQAKTYGADWSAIPHIGLARDKTLGLLGFGEIARPIARIARAFEMPVISWDIARFPELEEEYDVTYVEWDEIFRQSDILSVQLALNERTAGIIGAREIGLMRPDALFINTARGKLVDQAALTGALRSGRLGGAALDVFVDEPFPYDDPLHALHERPDGRVTLTPHIGWQSPWTWVRDSHEIWHNVLRSLRGEPVQHLVSD
ncbi:MAG: 2-hydroxyacid dehydrogenase [Chloroflexota bacterium]|nr:2-hydroxyacid dehydrogenase [Chloroflexota bacterium]